jgi:hypothetical protein
MISLSDISDVLWRMAALLKDNVIGLESSEGGKGEGRRLESSGGGRERVGGWRALEREGRG